MTVQIDFERSNIDHDDGKGDLFLHNPETGEDYWHWPFFANPEERAEYDANFSSASWGWENPGDPLEDITLSPSLLLERDGDTPNTFHIFVRGGEIQHCSDCQCGC